MTTELTLLLAIIAFIVLGVYAGDTGPRAVFFDAAPRLGARVEMHLSTGQGFNFDGARVQWEQPPGEPE